MLADARLLDPPMRAHRTTSESSTGRASSTASVTVQFNRRNHEISNTTVRQR